MADVTVTISVPDIEAHALAIVAASLAQSSSSRLMNIGSVIGGPWRTYSPQVEANMKDLMGDAAERVFEALADNRLRRSHKDGTAMSGCGAR